MRDPIKTLGRLDIYPDRGRLKTDHMGRFGGGWQYRLGLTAGNLSYVGGGTVLVGLGAKEYRVHIRPLSPAETALHNLRARKRSDRARRIRKSLHLPRKTGAK